MYFMGERKLARVPEDIEVYELAWKLSKTPDEIRAMRVEDIAWMQLIPIAQALAAQELAERKQNNGRNSYSLQRRHEGA
jgi:hypothetical protein